MSPKKIEQRENLELPGMEDNAMQTAENYYNELDKRKKKIKRFKKQKKELKRKIQQCGTLDRKEKKHYKKKLKKLEQKIEYLQVEKRGLKEKVVKLQYSLQRCQDSRAIMEKSIPWQLELNRLRCESNYNKQLTQMLLMEILPGMIQKYGSKNREKPTIFPIESNGIVNFPNLQLPDHSKEDGFDGDEYFYCN